MEHCQVRFQVRHGWEQVPPLPSGGGGAIAAFSIFVSVAPVTFLFPAFSAPARLSMPALDVITVMN